MDTLSQDRQSESRVPDRPVAIHCEGVSKTYHAVSRGAKQRVEALRNVSLSVGYGKIVGLVGPNGAGKTTLLQLLVGLITPTKGRISLCGYSPRSLEAKRTLGYVPEYPAFLGRYSAARVLDYHGALLGLSRRERRQRASMLLERFELAAAAQRPCGRFSQGMKQRLALAVALLGNPQVLVLDEPSNGLDPLGVVRLREELAQLSQAGACVMVSSHHLHELEKMTSSFLFLHHGELVQLGHRWQFSESRHLQIEVLRHDSGRLQAILDSWETARVSDSSATVRIESQEELVQLLAVLTQKGITIKTLRLDEPGIEEAFLDFVAKRTNL